MRKIIETLCSDLSKNILPNSKSALLEQCRKYFSLCDHHNADTAGKNISRIMCELRKFLTQVFVFNYNSDCAVVGLVFFVCLFCFRKDGRFISDLRNRKDFF